MTFTNENNHQHDKDTRGDSKEGLSLFRHIRRYFRKHEGHLGVE